MAAKQLKKAKLAIRDKDYDGAVEICQGILEDDTANYTALVFLGVGQSKLEQPHKAETAYRQATAVDPAQTLAWQGLSGLYEKAKPGELDDRDSKLLSVYQKLVLAHAADPKKVEELRAKIGPLLVELERTADAYEFYAAELVTAADGSGERKYAAGLAVKFGRRFEAELVKAHLRSIKIVNPTKSDTAKGRLSIAQDDPARFVAITAVIRAALADAGDAAGKGKLLAEVIERGVVQRDVSSAAASGIIEDCRAMAQLLPDSPFPLVTLLELADQDGVDIEPSSLVDTAAALHGLDTKAAPALAVLGAARYAGGEPAVGLTMLEESVTVNHGCLRGLVELSRISSVTLNVDKCIELASGAAVRIQQLEELSGNTWWTRTFVEMKLLEARACLESFGRLSQATAAYTAVVDRSLDDGELADAMAGLAEVSLADGNIDMAKVKAREVLAKSPSCHAAMSTLGWTAFAEDDAEAAEKLMRQAVAMDGAVSAYHYRLGRVLWNQGGDAKGQSVKAFILAVQHDPYNSHAFAYLGHFYRAQGGKSMARAMKCYEKCIRLSPLEFEAGRQLTRMHAADGDLPAVLRVCLAVTQAAKGSNMVKAAWAWKGMARAQKALGKIDDAVVSSQTAIRAAPHDAECWLLLGEAYSARGSYLAALKALEKSTEINPEQPYCIYKAANVEQALGHLPEAIGLYEHVLGMQAEFLPALFSAAEAWFTQAREYLSDSMLGAATEAIQTALAYSAKVLDISTVFSCVWKLIGDICTSVHVLTPELIAKIKIPVIPTVDEAGGLLALGTEAYKRVIAAGQTASGWTDLAASYLYRLKTLAPQPGAGDSAITTAALGASALDAAKRAVSIDAADPSGWNVLGAVATFTHDLALAQHAYVKSLEAAPNVAQTWVNLGALYLRCQDLELANKAFAMAQAIEPAMARAWVGQAMVAESFGSTEAMDLYRHAFELYPHPQACLGFGYHVVAATSIALEDTAPITAAAVPPARLPHGYESQYLEQALVALVAFTQTHHGCQDAQAFNCLGMLMERRGVATAAAKYYSRAAALLALDRTAGKECRMVQLNLARALTAAGDPAKSIEMYRRTGIDRLHDICGLGLAAYSAGDLATSYKVYEEALAVATRTSDKEGIAVVHTALATIACANGEHDLAKQLLFKAVVEPEVYPRALFVMCALGLATQDATLAASALAEFPKLLSKGVDSFEALLQDQALLQSALCRLQGLAGPALSALSAAIHTFPHMSKLWGDAAALLNASPEAIGGDKALKTNGTYDESYDPYTVCSVSAQEVRGLQNGDTPGRNLSLIAMGQLVSGQCRSYAHAVAMATKAVHENPGSVETWATLSASSFAHGAANGAAGPMRMAAVAADKCVALWESEYVAEQARPGRALQSTARTEPVRYWAQVQSCASRVACAALVERPEDAAKLVQEAAVLCQAAVRAYSHDPSRAGAFYAVYARCQLAYGQTAEGLQSLASSLKVDASSADAWEAVGVLYDNLWMHKEAAACYRQSIALLEAAGQPSKQVPPLLRLAVSALYRGGEVEAGFDSVTAAVRIENELPATRLCLGIAKLARGDAKAGKKELGRVAEDMPLAAEVLAAMTDTSG